MKLRTLLILLLVSSTAALATPTYYLANADLPNGQLGILQAERALWQSAAGTLASEGFESYMEGNPLDFGAFQASLAGGDGFWWQSGNNLITTEGNAVLYFLMHGNGTTVEFDFDYALNSFGLDITSIDFAPPTTVTFLDDNGNVLNDFAIKDVWGGATFFGVVNDQAFSKVRFDFTGYEYLAFDYLQYSSGPAIPEPTTLTLLGLGLLGAMGVIRRRR